jgi:hypothetical protein
LLHGFDVLLSASGMRFESDDPGGNPSGVVHNKGLGMTTDVNEEPIRREDDARRGEPVAGLFQSQGPALRQQLPESLEVRRELDRVHTPSSSRPSAA